MAVEPSELIQVVELLTGSADLGTWRATELHEAIASATAGIWRVQGEQWSLILKVISHAMGGHPNWRSGIDVDHWYYWRREALAYQSGLTSSFAGGLRGPICYLITERPDGSVALWLEDLGNTAPGPTWGLPRYRLAARDLGRAQGAFVTDRPLPSTRG